MKISSFAGNYVGAQKSQEKSAGSKVERYTDITLI